MHCKQSVWDCGSVGRTRPPPGRTIPLVLGLLVALVQGSVPGRPLVEGLGEMLSVDLEASMHTSVLSDLQTAASVATEGPPTGIPQSLAAVTEVAPEGIPDSSAVVGQGFHLRIPPRAKNGSCNVKVSIVMTRTLLLIEYSVPPHILVVDLMVIIKPPL